MSLFTKKELDLIKRLNTPSRVQDFLNSIEVTTPLSAIATIVTQ
jgi:hypothetical protein